MRDDRRADQRALHDRGHALGLQCGYQGFADTEFADHRFCIQLRVGRKLCAATRTALRSLGV
jgi:hypothetical protein